MQSTGTDRTVGLQRHTIQTVFHSKLKEDCSRCWNRLVANHRLRPWVVGDRVRTKGRWKYWWGQRVWGERKAQEEPFPSHQEIRNTTGDQVWRHNIWDKTRQHQQERSISSRLRKVLSGRQKEGEGLLLVKTVEDTGPIRTSQESAMLLSSQERQSRDEWQAEQLIIIPPGGSR